MFKEDPRQIIHVAADKISSEVNHITPSAYVSDKETAVPELYEAVEANSQRAAAARKENYNKQKLSFHQYNIGDQVWVNNTRTKRNVSRSLRLDMMDRMW